MCGHDSRARSRIRCRIGHTACRLGIFFNLATHMQAHARTCYDFFYRKFDAVLINDASQFACFFLSLQLQNSYAHVYKHVQLV